MDIQDYFGYPLMLGSIVVLTGMMSIVGLVQKRRLGRVGRLSASSSMVDSPQNSQHWIFEYSYGFFPVLLLVFLFRSFAFEPYRIPSGSMIPNLLVGDFILVDKFSYGLRWPVLNDLFLPVGMPQRGDVMVFKHPKEKGKNLIKRVIGLPGDHVRYANKRLYINGERIGQEPVGMYHGQWDPTLTMQQNIQQRSEQIGDKAHDILLLGQSVNAASQEWLVPEDHYFVMGDNRDLSYDSRAWGFVPDDHILGKAAAIWMHFHCRTGLDCFDFTRIGDSIE